jgi:hypothetical protein
MLYINVMRSRLEAFTFVVIPRILEGNTGSKVGVSGLIVEEDVFM